MPITAENLSKKQRTQAEELIDSFEMFDSWEEKYHFIIDLGRDMAPLPEADKIDNNRIHGCVSNVWMVTRTSNSPDGTLIHFDADSDSAIVKGLIAILHILFSGYPSRIILEFDTVGFMKEAGLSRHLSPNRKNGMEGMIQRLKAFALGHK